MIPVKDMELYQTLTGSLFIKDNRTQVVVEVNKYELEALLKKLHADSKQKQDEMYSGQGRPPRTWLKSSSNI